MKINSQQEDVERIQFIFHDAQVDSRMLTEFLLEEYLPALETFVLALSNDQVYASNLAEQVIQWAVKNRHKYWGEVSFQSWLFTEAYRRLQRLQKKDRKRIPVHPDQVILAAAFLYYRLDWPISDIHQVLGPENEAIRDALQEHLKNCLTCPPDGREAKNAENRLRREYQERYPLHSPNTAQTASLVEQTQDGKGRFSLPLINQGHSKELVFGMVIAFTLLGLTWWSGAFSTKQPDSLPDVTPQATSAAINQPTQIPAQGSSGTADQQAWQDPTFRYGGMPNTGRGTGQSSIPGLSDLSANELSFTWVQANGTKKAQRSNSRPWLAIYAAGKLTGEFPVGLDYLTACRFSPTSQKLAFIGYNLHIDNALQGLDWVDLNQPNVVNEIAPYLQVADVFEFSPSGRNLAFFACDQSGANCGIYIQDTSSLTIQKLVAMKDVGGLVWSPNGASVGFFGHRPGLAGIQLAIANLSERKITYWSTSNTENLDPVLVPLVPTWVQPLFFEQNSNPDPALATLVPGGSQSMFNGQNPNSCTNSLAQADGWVVKR